MSFQCHDPELPGRPDFSFHELRLAVFVDGDFWHGWRFPVWASNLSPQWRDKISGNRDRDARCHRRLRARGWRVLRIWEHQIERDAWSCFERIARVAGTSKRNLALARRNLERLPKLKWRNRLPRGNRSPESANSGAINGVVTDK
jgi:DNA mismatch endonuclease (patch repair protein)